MQPPRPPHTEVTRSQSLRGDIRQLRHHRTSRRNDRHQTNPRRRRRHHAHHRQRCRGPRPALQFDNHTGLWQVLGSAREGSLSQKCRAILRPLEEAPRPHSKGNRRSRNTQTHSTRHLLIRMRTKACSPVTTKATTHRSPCSQRARRCDRDRQNPVNGTDPSHSQAFTPNPPVNAVNGDTPEEVKNLHKKWIAGEFQGTDAQDELTAIFSKDRATTEDRARLRSLIQEHSA